MAAVVCSVARVVRVWRRRRILIVISLLHSQLWVLAVSLSGESTTHSWHDTLYVKSQREKAAAQV